MVFHVTFLLRSEMEEHMISRLSHATGPTDRLLLEMTIGDNFDHTATRFPDREAVVDLPTGRRWTYTALRAEVDALASVLIRTGMEAGDRIGIWAPNCAEWIIVQYAAAKVGAILVNLNPAYRTHEVEFALDQAGIRMVFALPSFRSSDYAAMLADVRPRTSALEHTVFFGTEQWASLLEQGRQISPDALANRQATLSPNDPINIQYTSGTTGFPKGVTLSHRNILNNGYFVGELLGYTEHDRVCLPVAVLPLLRHGDGQSRRDHPRSLRRDPVAGIRIRLQPCGHARTNDAPRCTACRRCSSQFSTSPASNPMTSPRCVPARWPAHHAPSRS